MVSSSSIAKPTSSTSSSIQAEPRRRGRRPEEFSQLASEFKSKTTSAPCKSKSFADDKTNTFILKLVKDRLFSENFNTLMRIYEEKYQNSKLTSNQKSRFLISLIKELENGQNLLLETKKKFLGLWNWDSVLEKNLRIQFCGTGERREVMKKLVDNIFRHIGLDEHLEEESFEYHDGLGVNLGDMCSSGMGMDFVGLGLDDIQPLGFGEEKENNRIFIDEELREMDSDSRFDNIEMRDERMESEDEQMGGADREDGDSTGAESEN